MTVTSLQASLNPFSVVGKALTATVATDSSVMTVGRAETATEKRRTVRALKECIFVSWYGSAGGWLGRMN